MKNAPTQKELVLSHLQNHGGITDDEAREKYGIHRLGARVFELRKMGYPIKSDPQKSKNRYGKTVRYDRYVLEG